MKRRDLIIGAGATLATCALIRPAAPYVITKPWRHWPYAHGRRQFLRKVPEGLHISPFEDFVKYRDPENDRLYNIQPLHPDVRDWVGANADKLRERFIRRHAPNQQLVNNIVGAVTPEFNGISFFLFQSFMGISQVAQSPNGNLSFWTGLQGTHSKAASTVHSSSGGSVTNSRGTTWLMQPVMQHDGSESVTSWAMQNECFVGASGGGELADFVDGQVAITAGTAFWSRIQYSRANGGFWAIEWFTGTNKRVGGLVPGLPGLRISPDANGEQIADFDLAQCSMEFRGGSTSCADLDYQCVFGGLRLVRGGLAQVQWRGEVGGAISCSQSFNISNMALNPNAVITLTG